jgi:hypothetical protein
MIPAERVEEIITRVEREGLDEAAVSGLRAAYPGIHFTYCLDDDVGTAEPLVERPGFRVYLVDGRSHCLCLTADPALATGILLAEVVEDEQA